MDGRRRALDNVFIERMWRSLKYELIHPGDFGSGQDLFPALDKYSTCTNVGVRTSLWTTRRPNGTRTASKERGGPHDGALSPTPRDLSLLFARMDISALLMFCHRTVERHLTVKVAASSDCKGERQGDNRGMEAQRYKKCTELLRC